MKFRLIEQYQLDNGAYTACLNSIKLGMNNEQCSTRGNGVTVSILLSLYEYLTGKKLSSADYILHHINGKHADNRIDNVVLFKKNLSHTAFHIDVVKKVAYTFASTQNIRSETKIPAKIFNEATPQQLTELSNLFMSICSKKTFRNKNEDEIIYIPDYIVKS